MIRFIFSNFLMILLLISLFSCQDDNEEPENRNPTFSNIYFSIKFDSLQDRLDNQGGLYTIPIGHNAQSPKNYSVNIAYIELLTDSTIPFGEGVSILNQGTVFNATDTGYSCCQSSIEENHSYYASLKLNESNKTFQWIRIYFIFQNYNINYLWNGAYYSGGIASFLAQKALTYYYQIDDSIYNQYSLKVNGEWFLEVDTPTFGAVLSGTSLTSSPNVIYSSMPSPMNSCIATCAINPSLQLATGESKTITISISIKNSFEWIEHSTPNHFEPFDGDTIFDLCIGGVEVHQ